MADLVRRRVAVIATPAGNYADADDGQAVLRELGSKKTKTTARKRRDHS
jgi:hypothetical protein